MGCRRFETVEFIDLIDLDSWGFGIGLIDLDSICLIGLDSWERFGVELIELGGWASVSA
jgi:hypothetical protein